MSRHYFLEFGAKSGKKFIKNSQKKCNRSRKKTRPPGFFEKTDSLFSSLLCVIAGQTLLAWRSAPFFLHPFLPLLPPTAPLARSGYNPQDAFCAGPPRGNMYALWLTFISRCRFATTPKNENDRRCKQWRQLSDSMARIPGFRKLHLAGSKTLRGSCSVSGGMDVEKEQQSMMFEFARMFDM